MDNIIQKLYSLQLENSELKSTLQYLKELTASEAKTLKKADEADKESHKPGEKESPAHDKFHKTVEGMVGKKLSKKEQDADDHNGEGSLESVYSERDERKGQMQQRILTAHKLALDKAMAIHNRKMGGKSGNKCEKSMFDMYMSEFENNIKDLQ
jgi:hypothetical protein